MKFDDLNSKMRIFEISHDHCVLPGIYMVARLDGRNFTRLIREKHRFEVPYDPLFRDHMIATTKHLMDCGFRVVFAYTQSDEISLLFHPDDQVFQRKLRKYNSVLAGEASAKFSLFLGDIACFDCRICQLPNIDLVVDYFRWRSEDAHRNALNSYCYWTLRSEGMEPQSANNTLSGVSFSEKNELLFRRGINFNHLPNWQKRGVGLYWEVYKKDAINKKTREHVKTERRRIKIDMELPMKEAYSAFIKQLLSESITVK